MRGGRWGRWWSYFGAGLSAMVGRAIALFSYATSIYYLFIVNTPQLLSEFPSFASFLIFGIVIVAPIITFIGRFFWKSQFSVQDLLNNPLWKLFYLHESGQMNDEEYQKKVKELVG
ncbi:MAG: hypothetical protein KGI38_12775 [Thaumarchaeota archaeon]|nr:hypothetical protein [Nitrososphaerota archaeon]